MHCHAIVFDSCLIRTFLSGGPSAMEEAERGDGASQRQNWTLPSRGLHLAYPAASYNHCGKVQHGWVFLSRGRPAKLVISIPFCCPCRRCQHITWRVGKGSGVHGLFLF